MATDDTSGSVAIVGGGIGGLAAALALSRKGYRVDVLERRPELSEDGAGIQIGPNGMRILTALNVDRRLEPYVGKPERIGVLDGLTGQRMTQLPLGSWIERRHGAPYWVAHRADLQLALWETLKEESSVSLTLATQVKSIADEPGSPVSVISGEGRQWQADAVIVADGLWSPVRTSMFSSLQPLFSGKSAVRAVVPIEDVPKSIRTDEVGVWLSPKGHIVHYPVQGALALAIVIVLKDETATQEWSSRVHPSWVQHGVRDFPAPVRELVAKVPQWRKWALYELAVPANFVKGRVALLGDAAHPVLPFLAQGGVLALEDAMVIADCLANSPTPEAAFQSYEQKRRPRVSKVQSASKRNGEIYHYSGLLAQARNMTLKNAPGSWMMAGYDWLYSWKAPGLPEIPAPTRGL